MLNSLFKDKVLNVKHVKVHIEYKMDAFNVVKIKIRVWSVDKVSIWIKKEFVLERILQKNFEGYFKVKVQ